MGNEKKIIAPWYELRNGEMYLRSKGRYKTKLVSEDLPGHYLGYHDNYGNMRYIDIRNLKRVYYKGNFVFDHYFKDDMLILFWSRSSDEHSVFRSEESFDDMLYHCDLLIFGNEILNVIATVARQNPAFDMSPIVAEIYRKLNWLRSEDRGELSRFDKALDTVKEKIGPNPIHNEYRSLSLSRYISENPDPEDPADDFARFCVVAAIERASYAEMKS